MENTGFVAFSAQEYVEHAVTLALDPARLALMRHDLRRIMAESALMDLSGITRDLEQAYVSMFEATCRERSPF